MATNKTASKTTTGEKETPAEPLANKKIELPITKKKKPWWLFVLVLVASCFGYYYWEFVPKQTAEVTTVEIGDAAAAVYGTVMVEPTKQYLIRPQVNGTVTGFNLKLGDFVKKGQVIAEIVDLDFTWRLKAAEHARERAYELRKLGPTSLPAMEAKRELLVQLKKLVGKDNISKSEFEKNAAELLTLEAKVQEERVNLEGLVNRAETELEMTRNADKKRKVEAPMDGQVLELYVSDGIEVSSSSSLILLGTKEVTFRVSVNEEDVSDLKEGMKGTVKLYSYLGQEFNATVKSINPMGTNAEYSVFVELEKPPVGLLPGMSGEANIKLGMRPQVLMIPTRAVRGSIRYPFVNVVNRNGVVKRRTIKTGYRSMELTEVTEGLSKGDLVIINNQDQFQLNAKVRTRIVPKSDITDVRF